MLNQIKRQLHSRQHAGRLLAEKLHHYKNTGPESIVLAIPHGGIPVGYEVASALGIAFDIVFSKRIRHPANSDQSIGAVSMNEVVLHETTQFIPQHYVLNQIAQLQRMLQEQFHRYYGSKSKKSLRGKTVILIDDVLRDIDELQASLQTIRKEEPAKIILAAPVASIKVVYYLAEENYEFHYLFMELGHQTKAFTYFPEITEEESKLIFNSSGSHAVTS